MTRRMYPFLIILFLSLGGASALAWNGVEILDAHGRVEHLNFGSGGMGPDHCYWDHADSPDPFFHITNADAIGIYDTCDDPWLAHADADSLSFHGAWPLSESWTANSTEYGVDLSCTVSIAANTRLRAERLVLSTDLTLNEHELVLIYPDGSIQSLLGEGPEPDSAQLILTPGIYEVNLHVMAKSNRPQGENIIEPYDGRVSLYWEEPGTVGVERVDWSSLKAIYR